jgi:benzoyl-CoA reductase/2-hydroxyglutaryl-CoA dehydratase subunit BcrC/BadD/HgdB
VATNWDVLTRRATSQLISVYEHPLHHAQDLARAGGSVAGLLSHTVPWELLRAAGLNPTLLRSTPLETRDDDERLETNVFSPRIRSLFNAAISGAWREMRAVFVARTSEPEYKLHLYLREAVREAPDSAIPPIVFYDLLHSRSAGAYAYGLERTRVLMGTLEAMTGHRVTDADLARVIKESNAARAAVRRLLALRLERPRIQGSLAMRLIGPFHLMPRTEYAALANRAADELEGGPETGGPRLLIQGPLPDDPALHEVLEAHGAVVVAEDGHWGSRIAGADIATEGDPFTAIFDKYYADTPSPRRPLVADDRTWMETVVRTGLEGVVFFLPLDDSVAGWDYPRERARIRDLGLPTLTIRADASELLAPEWRREIAAFVAALPQPAGDR